jgi:hypothetical protein
MTRDEVIRLAREANMGFDISVWGVIEELQAFAAMVAEAEADKHDTGTHTCSNRCQRYACVAVREAVAAEREACAKMCEEVIDRCVTDCAAAIRARGIP